MQATAFGVLPHKDFLSIPQLSTDEVRRIFDVAAELERGRDAYTSLLGGKRLAMTFEKDSRGFVKLYGLPGRVAAAVQSWGQA